MLKVLPWIIPDMLSFRTIPFSFFPMGNTLSSISDADMVLLARDISKQIEAELEYPGQIKVNVIRESRVIDYAK